MKKILILFIALIISGCSKDKISETKIKYTEETKINKIDMPQDWSEKYSTYGYFYTDYETSIIILEDYKEDSVLDSIKESFNYYLLGKIKLTDEFKITNKNNEDDNFLIETNNKDYGKIFVQKIKSENKIVAITSTNDEKIYETYKKIFNR